MTIEAMKQALEALESFAPHNGVFWRNLHKEDAEIANVIASLRQAIEQAEKQEPVAWATMLGSYSHVSWGKDRPDYPIRYEVPLYPGPQPQREWVGLTDEEMRELEKQFNAERVRTSDEEYLVIYPGDYWQWQRAIEAKLKEKNT